MRLYMWRGRERNFGDELNTVLWPSLLPGQFASGMVGQDRTEDLFLGIGSVLDTRHPLHCRKIVAGAGYGGYEMPTSLDGSWAIYWVRGPRTARQLGLPSAFGLGDPASLLPLVQTQMAPAQAHELGFMPHFESLSRGPWAAAATAAGVTLIDPRADPDTICKAIADCRVLLSEALHGAIVADALRVPWVALLPMVPIHRLKWFDWADAMDVSPRFQALPGFSSHAWAGAGCLDRASSALRRAAMAPPQLSPGASLDRAQTRMLARLHTLRQDRGAPRT